MKILLIHNRYRIRSGEHHVFNNEVRMLKKYGHEIREVVFDNKDLESSVSRIKAGLFSVYNPFSSKKIRGEISEFSPHVIHVHNFFPQISPAVFFRKTRKDIPVVMTLHNYRLICANALLFRKSSPCEKCIRRTFPLSGILHRCYRNSFFQTFNVVWMTSVHKWIGTWRKRVDRFIALSDFQRSKILESSLGIKKERIVIKPNFVFDETGNEPRRPGDYFIFIGRLEEDKGVDLLMSAFAGLQYQLKIIGDGPLRDTVESWAEKKENIEYLGPRDNTFVIGQLRSAKALIFPSKYYEGFPMVLAEAFYCGTPVITSDGGSQGEIVTDGYNGLHFRDGDPGDLKCKVETFARHPEGVLSRNAGATFRKLYSVEKNHEQLMKIYREVMEETEK